MMCISDTIHLAHRNGDVSLVIHKAIFRQDTHHSDSYYGMHCVQVLEDVVEYQKTPDGRVQKNRLDQILLNGNNIALLVPGRSPEDSN